jgi:hypothetical protein
MGSKSSRWILVVAIAAALGLPLLGAVAQVATEAAIQPAPQARWFGELEDQLARAPQLP